MKKVTIFLVLVFAISFTACDSFFSESWGTAREYDTSNLDVNAGNVNDWIHLAVGNPDLAAALVDKITQELKNVFNPWERAELLEAGVRLSVEASGLGTSFLTHAADILRELDDNFDVDSLEGILVNVQDDFNSGRGIDAANNLASMAMECIVIDSNGVPRFDNFYTQTANSVDVTEALIVLVLGELGDNSVEDNWNNIALLSEGLQIRDDVLSVTSNNASENTIALAAYLNLISSNPQKFGDNPFTSFFD